MKAKGGLEAPGKHCLSKDSKRELWIRQTDSVYKGIGQPGHGGICLPSWHSGGRDAQMHMSG